MCRFVIAVLPKAVSTAELDAIARAHGKCLRAMHNESIEAQGNGCFLTTPGHCDCDTPLGEWTRTDEVMRIDRATEAKKSMKKGWSLAKAEKSLAQKLAHAEKAIRSTRARDAAALTQWVAFIDGVVSSGKSPQLGLWMRQYEGALDIPALPAAVERVAVAQAAPELLGRMREDVLYLFHH